MFMKISPGGPAEHITVICVVCNADAATKGDLCGTGSLFTCEHWGCVKDAVEGGSFCEEHSAPQLRLPFPPNIFELPWVYERVSKATVPKRKYTAYLKNTFGKTINRVGGDPKESLWKCLWVAKDPARTRIKPNDNDLLGIRQDIGDYMLQNR